jgi:hypothetical protein
VTDRTLPGSAIELGFMFSVEGKTHHEMYQAEARLKAMPGVFDCFWAGELFRVWVKVKPDTDIPGLEQQLLSTIRGK